MVKQRRALTGADSAAAARCCGRGCCGRGWCVAGPLLALAKASSAASSAPAAFCGGGDAMLCCCAWWPGSSLLVSEGMCWVAKKQKLSGSSLRSCGGWDSVEARGQSTSTQPHSAQRLPHHAGNSRRALPGCCRPAAGSSRRRGRLRRLPAAAGISSVPPDRLPHLLGAGGAAGLGQTAGQQLICHRLTWPRPPAWDAVPEPAAAGGQHIQGRHGAGGQCHLTRRAGRCEAQRAAGRTRA